MRQCKRCGTKFEQGEEPNPKCPRCNTRATKQMTKSGNKQKITEKKEKGLSMWQTLQARKAASLGGKNNENKDTKSA